ncbi:DUF177 domain-containing protein [Limibaculum sp. M0105]|uniref:DUF177 domain-containing protein n=1 Tax=Thermohalobaculum xanthum TaxID=2753746 RepID=A0A8J7M5U7_9RHOB|nr:YceD family protein [Thermohalobaculum xanthum]MBK0398392.1 DUF177 domain-containing protein [Thermohalobaculum xanthum]
MTDPLEPDLRPLPLSRKVPVASLSAEAETPVSLVPDAAELDRLAQFMGIKSLSDVALEGGIAAYGRKGWRLDARLKARVGQVCVVTLEPIETDVDSPVRRAFQPGAERPGVIAINIGESGDEGEEEPPEPLGEDIDLGAILVEELALAIDPYPRAPGAELGTMSRTPPGAAPLDPEAEKPFAKLASLRARLAGESD